MGYSMGFVWGNLLSPPADSLWCPLALPIPRRAVCALHCLGSPRDRSTGSGGKRGISAPPGFVLD